MKRFLSLLLAFAVCFALLATTSLADYLGKYTKNPDDYNQMLDCVNKGSYNIQLTQEYFAINPTEYNKGNYYKFQFESDGAEVQAAAFLMPGEILSAIGTSTTLLTKTPIAFSRDDSKELDCSGNSGAIQYGAYFGFNILTTSLSEYTTITVSVYCTNTGNGKFEKVDEITYELKAAEQVSDEALGMSVECADRSGTEVGKQVYAGDTVEVSFTGADKFTGTSALFSFDDSFKLVSAPGGWTQQDAEGYLYEVDGTALSDLGKFVLEVKTPPGESGTGTLTLSNRFSSGEPVDTTETLYVIGKPIQYTITGLGSNNAVTAVYDGQPHHIEVVVTEPANAVIQYSGTSLEDIVDGKPIAWQGTPPEWVDVSFDQPVGGYYATTIKITADGYKTVETSVNLAITPAQLTITPLDVTLDVGDALPTTFKYDITGLVGGDTLTTAPTITCNAADTSKPGTYTLTATGADAGDNYTITYATGKLTVKDVWTVKLDGVEYKVEKGQPFTFPTEAPTKPGYIFMGWRGADGATYQPGEEVAISGDTSFKAVWANMPDVTPGGGDEPDVDVFPFYDVSVNAWYYDAVKYVWDNGLMNGTGTAEFSPNTTLNRAMVWTILARLDGVSTDGGANWYAKAQAWAMAEGVSDGTDPMGAVTREQLVTMLWHFKGEPAVDFLLTAKDADTISDWAYEAMRWAVAEGIIEGDDSGLVSPAATATRAQAAAIFMRFRASVK